MSDDFVTVLITDMEGSTAFTEGLGDEVAMDLIRVHEQLVRAILAQHDGREIKSMGDGFMIAFTSPQVGVGCALDIQERLDSYNESHPAGPIRVRMGMNSGPVIEEKGDLYGTTVNAASRITAKARAGQLLVSEAVRDGSLEAGDWRFIDRGLYWLKGLRERWTLYEATRGHERSHPSLLEGQTPFIDRDEERAALRRYTDACIDGRGNLVLLAGDAGAGKTRLAEEIASEASGRGMRFLVGRCYEATQTHPFGPIVDVLEAVERGVSPEMFRMILGEAAGEIARLIPHLRRHFPDIPTSVDLPDPDQARRYLFTSLRDVLSALARQRPLFLLLDDLHWADEQSLWLVEQLAPDLKELPILIVGTYIPTELAASSPLQTTLEMLHRRRLLERLQIGPLAPQDLGALLDALVGKQPPSALVDLLYRETEGNVFFAEEVVRDLLEQGRIFDEHDDWRNDIETLNLDVPETIRLTIERRFKVLSQATRGVLITAAVVGRAFGFDLLEALTELSEDDLIDALDEAERSRVITSTSEGGAVQFRFSHELIRQTLAADSSLARRQRLHHRIATAMEHIYSTALSEHAAEIAYHLTEAGRRADAASTARFLVLAGERAHEAGAYEDAVRHFDRALALLTHNAPDERGQLLEKLGTATRSLGQLDDALSTWREALDEYEAAGQRHAVARLCLDAGMQVAFWRRGREVLELVDRGLDALGDQRTAERGGLLALAGAVASQGGDYAGGEELLEEALQIAREHNDDRVLGLALYSRAAHHFGYTQYPQAIDFARESVQHLRRTSDLWNLANALAYAAISSSWMGRFDDATTVGAEAEELARRVGSWSAWAFADRAQRNPEFGRRPDLDWYGTDGRQALELGTAQGFVWLSAIGWVRIGLAAFWRGEWTDALSHFESAVGLQAARAAAGYHGRLILTHAYLGHRFEALEMLERNRPDFPQLGLPNRTDRWTLALMAAETFAVLGDYEHAAELYPTVLEVIDTGAVARGLDFRLLQTLAGITAGCGRRWDCAEEHFSEALRLARDLPMRLEEPEACRFYARMLIERAAPDDRDRARVLLVRAIDIYREIGMAAHEELARDLLDQTA